MVKLYLYSIYSKLNCVFLFLKSHAWISPCLQTSWVLVLLLAIRSTPINPFFFVVIKCVSIKYGLKTGLTNINLPQSKFDPWIMWPKNLPYVSRRKGVQFARKHKDSNFKTAFNVARDDEIKFRSDGWKCT